MSQIDEKNAILDLRIRLKSGVEIDVEIQVIEHKAYIERILSYWAKMYQGNLKVGDNYENLRKCIIVNIIGFKLFEVHNMHSKFQIRSDSDGRLLTIQNKPWDGEALSIFRRYINPQLLISV